jgi:hypothetical protein
MKIDEALIILYNLKNTRENKAETIIYNNIIAILLDLEQRDFTLDQIKDIEIKLSSLELKNNLYSPKKELNKKLTSLECFLNDKFSIITKNYYINIGMALWLFSSILLFYCFGQFSVIGALLVTTIFGVVLDAEAKRQGRVIKIVTNRIKPSFIEKPFVIEKPFSIENPLELDELSEEEKHQKDKRRELQHYRRKKLQQFGKEQPQPKGPTIKKQEY